MTREEFEKWLRSEKKTRSGQTVALLPGAIIMPGDRFC
jgi:hypothetical protein